MVMKTPQSRIRFKVLIDSIVSEYKNSKKKLPQQTDGLDDVIAVIEKRVRLWQNEIKAIYLQAKRQPFISEYFSKCEKFC